MGEWGECDNAEMRDRLPELLGPGESVSEGRLAPVRAHLEQCAECRAELELLDGVRAALPAPRVDAGRIAATIAPYKGASRRGGMLASPLARIAAAVILVAGGGLLVTDASQRAVQDTVGAALPAAGATSAELAVGAPLRELSEGDLRELIDSLGSIEAVTSAEGDVVEIPAFELGSGA